MKLKIAGGCGEHGRNCFFVDCTTPFLVDCGIKAGEKNPFPDLTQAEIARLEYVFLTHSHADHTGAMPWLYKRGFSGVVIASAPTLEQLAFKPKNSAAAENLNGEAGGVKFKFGKSGHCLGAVWYEFQTDGKKLLFSGDYTENSTVYRCDAIRGTSADIAVIDCAYGSDCRNFSECCAEIISAVSAKKTRGTMVFPVPKYGRGLELLRLINEHFPNYSCCGDEHFMKQFKGISDRRWYKNAALRAQTYADGADCDILFLSDPQLRGSYSQNITESILARGGSAVMTGTPERGSTSERLIQSGEMLLLRYPVHQNYAEYTALVNKNTFGRTIPFHSAELSAGETVIEC